MYLNYSAMKKIFSTSESSRKLHSQTKSIFFFSFLPCLLSLTMFFIAVNFSYQILHTNDEEWEDSQVSQKFWLRLWFQWKLGQKEPKGKYKN